jgi:NAD-dependent SIR2 family protein deacetylase
LAAQELREKSEITSKRCSHCGRTLPIEDFHKNAKEKDGYCKLCKECKNASRVKTVKSLGEARERIKDLENQLQFLQKINCASLKDCTPRQLIDELARRGYKGEMTYVQHIKF